MEAAKLDTVEHSSYHSNKDTVTAGATGTAETAGRVETVGVAELNSAAPENPPTKKLSSKSALAMVMDFSILSNSTVMLIDVIQQWQLNKHEPILTALLVLLPIVMFLQLPVAVLVILAGHGQFSENTRRLLQNWILALLTFSTALMLVSDLLKVKADSSQILIASVDRSQE